MKTEKDTYLMLSISTPERSKGEAERPQTNIIIKDNPPDVDVCLRHVSTMLCIFLTAEEMGCLNQDPDGSGR